MRHRTEIFNEQWSAAYARDVRILIEAANLSTSPDLSTYRMAVAMVAGGDAFEQIVPPSDHRRGLALRLRRFMLEVLRAQTISGIRV